MTQIVVIEDWISARTIEFDTCEPFGTVNAGEES